MKLTFGVCAVGDLRAQNYRATPNFKRSYMAANCDKTPIAYDTVLVAVFYSSFNLFL